MTSKTRCKKCNKFSGTGKGTLSCKKCRNDFHFKCADLSEQKVKACLSGKDSFTCKYCLNYPCGRCKLPVFDHQNALCCDASDCLKWYHLKCTRVSLWTYNRMVIGTNSECWHCDNCYKFPFSHLDESLFKAPEIPTLLNISSNACSICSKNINARHVDKSVYCSFCNSLVHRKCSGLSLYDLNRLPKNHFKNWGCSKCMHIIPFNELNTHDLLKQNFNSNFNCHCKVKSPDLNSCILNFDTTWAKYGPDPDNDVDQVYQANITFDYYSAHDFHKTKNKNKNPNFSILHTNIQSLMHNFDNLEDLVVCSGQKFDVIGLSETWNPKSKSNIFRPGNLEGYHRYTGQMGNSIKSGCGLYINKDLTFTERKKLDISYADENNEFQGKWIEIVNSKHVNTLIGVIYRHPRKTSDNSFLNYLDKTLTQIKKENKNIILMGDFNYCLLKYEKDKKVKSFVDLTQENHLQPCILGPTRILPGQKPSLVDNIFTNIIEKNIYSGNFTDKITDHLPNFAVIKNHHLQKTKTKITKRDFRQFQEADYLEDIANITLNLEFNDVNSVYSSFQQQLQSIMDKHAPMKTYSNRESKWLRKPWLTKGIQNSIKKKQFFYNKYLKNNKDRFWYLKYRAYKNRLEYLIKISKQKFYKNYFENNLKNSKKVWNAVNEIIHKGKKQQSTEIFLNEDGKIITDQNKVANIFNNFYANVAENLVKKLPKPTTKFQDYLKNPNKSCMTLSEIEPDEVFKILKSLDVHKSADIFNISPKLIRIAAPALCLPLTHIFNMTFVQGVFPDLLKIAKIIPVHKGDSKFDASNYRPISLLPIISKILERLMYSRLCGFVISENILYKRQYGFQKNKNTEMAILDLQSKIIESFEKEEIPCAIFLDFAKAFDTVNHEILIHKLHHYGIRDTPLKWLKSYLTNRKQCVGLQNSISTLLDIKHGVPQGSVLGPLLFLISINDIVNTSKLLNFYLFADDTCLFYSHKSKKTLEQTLNDELLSLSAWLTANKLTLNVEKTNALLFRPKNASKTLDLNLKINGENIKEKEFAKYLGIIIDNKLTFSHHIDKIKNKIAKGNSLLAKLRHYVPTSVLKNLYNAHIQPFLDYGVLVWSNSAKTHLDSISSSQDKSIRILNFQYKDSPTEPLYKDNKILPLDKLIKVASSKFIWNIKNGYVPATISDIMLTHNVHLNNRNPLRYTLPYRKTSHGKNFFTFNGIKIWNQIPDKIISSFSPRIFKRSYTDYLLSLL